MILSMSTKKDGNPVASALAKIKWKGMSAEERSEHARMMAEERWKGHGAKPPASSRKKAAK
jgi:hypothetical protein